MDWTVCMQPSFSTQRKMPTDILVVLLTFPVGLHRNNERRSDGAG
jgi:hypothetical protein